ncbi:uncharacterized protein LOC121370199 [Gigantopelta aegis]|uniref:uncharacterized protein LOC121370199 n=1 Tax=Gigantopelta aegis TaxID=1735272 RepID=UPI001B88CE97|nr:uncharacterized protein LOC121370199 [Gigantopelta aegis]
MLIQTPPQNQQIYSRLTADGAHSHSHANPSNASVDSQPVTNPVYSDRSRDPHEPRDSRAETRAQEHVTAERQHVTAERPHPTATTMTTAIKPRLPMTNISICDGNRLTIVTGPCILLKATTVAQQVQALRPLKQIKPNEEPEALRCKRRIDFQKLGYTLPKAQPATVHRRNARERNRVKLVNLGFETLREHVPSGKVNKKLSKVETLRSAVEYIKELQNILNCYDEETSPSPMDVGSNFEQTITDSDVIGGSPSISDTSSLCSPEHDHNDNALNSYVDGSSAVSDDDYKIFSVGDIDSALCGHQQITSSVDSALCGHQQMTSAVDSALCGHQQMTSSDASSPGSACSESSYDSLGSIDDKDILRFSRWLTQLYSSAVHDSISDTVSQVQRESVQSQLS